MRAAWAGTFWLLPLPAGGGLLRPGQGGVLPAGAVGLMDMVTVVFAMWEARGRAGFAAVVAWPPSLARV